MSGAAPAQNEWEETNWKKLKPMVIISVIFGHLAYEMQQNTPKAGCIPVTRASFGRFRTGP